MPDDSDAALVAATLSGSMDSFATLVERHQRRLFHVLIQLTGSPDDAADVAQDAFVRAHGRLATYDPAYRFFPWLCQIAVNLWRNQLRRDGRLVALEDMAETAMEVVDPTPSPESSATQDELRRRVWRAVADLPEDARQVVILRHAMELSYEEIVAETGLPMGTVKSRLARARRALAATLESVVD